MSALLIIITLLFSISSLTETQRRRRKNSLVYLHSHTYLVFTEKEPMRVNNKRPEVLTPVTNSCRIWRCVLMCVVPDVSEDRHTRTAVQESSSWTEWPWRWRRNDSSNVSIFSSNDISSHARICKFSACWQILP
jgi:hypothetical protein